MLVSRTSPPSDGQDWLGLSSEALPTAEAQSWVVVPGCGGVVCFVGTVRDHADGRDGVTGLVYEAYEEHATGRMEMVAAETRARYPGIGRLVLLHRVGALDVTDAAVVVAVSAPHRDEAFAAARFAIDAVKASVPIWKRESWADGDEWGTGALDVRLPAEDRGRWRTVNNVVFLLLALAVAAVVIIGLWWRDRRPPSIEEGIDAFHRELEALAPESYNQPIRPNSPPSHSPSPSSEEGRPG